MRFTPPLLLLLPSLIGLSGCLVGVDDEAPTLQVLGSIPEGGESHPADLPIRVQVDRYLDPAQDWLRAVELTSGNNRLGAWVGYDPAAPGLVVVPTADLRPGLGYSITLVADRLRALDGGRLSSDYTFSFLTARPTSGPRETPPVRFEEDVLPILRRGCGCHGPELPPALTYEALVEQPSLLDPDRMMVRPGLPLESTLIIKALPGYPDRVGGQMPPGAEPLDEESLRTLVSWVVQL